MLPYVRLDLNKIYFQLLCTTKYNMLSKYKNKVLPKLVFESVSKKVTQSLLCELLDLIVNLPAQE
jgi:hypothetical protein